MTRTVWMICALAMLLVAPAMAAGKPMKKVSSTTPVKAAPAAPSASSDRVVAVVNDQVITLSQLKARTELNIRQVGMTGANQDQRNAMMKRTLGMLIDEELQRQFAQGTGMQPTKEEIEEGKRKAIENVGTAKWAELTKGLTQASNDKIAGELRWQDILAHEVRPRVNIGTAEVDRLIQELAKSRHVLERQISMILVQPGDGNADKEQLKKVQDIRERIAGGSSFADEAKAYSDDKSAVNGGDLGWFASGELNPELEDALDKMQPGEVSQPIRTPLGWHLIKLENVRTTKPIETGPVTQYELYLLAAKASSDTTVNKDLDKKLDKATDSLEKPDAVRAYFGSKQFGDTFPTSTALGWVMVNDLQPDLVKALEDVKPGHWSGNVQLGNDFGRVYVADSQVVMPKNLEAYRQKVTDSLMGTRMELGARQFMRELRQKAFVDVRL